MSEYAYWDLERTIKVDPITAFGERGKVDHYYCPNKECMAYLRLFPQTEGGRTFL